LGAPSKSPRQLKEEFMSIVDEIKKSPEMTEYFKKSPTEAMSFLKLIESGYQKEWAGFVAERDAKRSFWAINAPTANWREVALIPPFMKLWINFLNEGAEPSKPFMRAWLKQHPEFWIKPNLFVRR
jgi:hypothetical protein